MYVMLSYTFSSSLFCYRIALFIVYSAERNKNMLELGLKKMMAEISLARQWMSSCAGGVESETAVLAVPKTFLSFYSFHSMRVSMYVDKSFRFRTHIHDVPKDIRFRAAC